MSQRSKRARISQPSQNLNASQAKSTQAESSQSSADDLVKKCVRLFLVRMGSNVPIKRAQLIQQLFKERPGKMFDIVINRAREILQNVYGLKLRTLDEETANKKYILTNDLEQPHLVTNFSDNDLKVTITFLVLTHVFMSKDCATETSLWEFLNGVSITPQTELFGVGNVHTFITKQLVKEQYIQVETVGATSDGEEAKKKFSWGTRAEECVSKMNILQFVSKMYDNMSVKTWSSRYEEAVKQADEVEDIEMVENNEDSSD